MRFGTEPAVKAVSRADMETFWKQNFVPNNAALVVAGDITMAELKPLAEKAFGAWPSGSPAKPVLGNPLNRHRAVPLTYDQFRFGFANAVEEDEAKPCTRNSPSLLPGRRCSRPRPRTSTRGPRQRLTPRTQSAGRCC